MRREKAVVRSRGYPRPGTGSLHPVTIRVAVEATRLLKPLVQRVVDKKSLFKNESAAKGGGFLSLLLGIVGDGVCGAAILVFGGLAGFALWGLFPLLWDHLRIRF
jgi:hypothetical protein